MLKIGDVKKYTDIDGSKFEDKIIAITEFNYITTAMLIVPHISCGRGENDILDFLKVKNQPENIINFSIHNKAIKDVNKKYRKIYSNILKEIKQDDDLLKNFKSLYKYYYIDDISLCVNINEYLKLYKKEGAMEQFIKYCELNV